MDWNFVKVYMAIYRERTIAAAAKSLQMSESTFARHLSQCEKNMGRLFVRHRGRYTLTEFGEEILEKCLVIEQTFNDIDRKAFAKDGLAASSVRITAPTSFAVGYLPSIIEQLNIVYPEIIIELLVSNEPMCLDVRQADIAVRVTRLPPDNYIGKKVRDIQWAAYCGLGYVHDYGAPEVLASLKEHRIIGAAGALVEKPVFRWLRDNLAENIHVCSDDLVAMCSLAANNHGVAFLPDEFNQIGLKRLFTLDQISENHLWVLTHSDFRNVERVRIVARFLASALENDELIWR